jgi:hypothetical protein
VWKSAPPIKKPMPIFIGMGNFSRITEKGDEVPGKPFWKRV